MKILLDTHIILWSFTNDIMLSEKAKKIICDNNNQIYYSTASIWEVSIKHMSKPDKMIISGTELSEKCKKMSYTMLPISDIHVKFLETLKRPETAPPHNDPFDRIMISQAKAENMKFITHDTLIPFYNEECVISV